MDFKDVVIYQPLILQVDVEGIVSRNLDINITYGKYIYNLLAVHYCGMGHFVACFRGTGNKTYYYNGYGTQGKCVVISIDGSFPWQVADHNATTLYYVIEKKSLHMFETDLVKRGEEEEVTIVH